MKPKPLDFHKLFSDQPDAHYFPSGVYGENINILGQADKIFLDPQESDEIKANRVNNIIQTANGLNDQLKKVSRREYLDQYAPSIHKGHFQATTIMLTPDNRLLTTMSKSKLSFDQEKRPLKDMYDVIHEEKKAMSAHHNKYGSGLDGIGLTAGHTTMSHNNSPNQGKSTSVNKISSSHKSLSFGPSPVDAPMMNNKLNRGHASNKSTNKMVLSSSGKMLSESNLTMNRSLLDEHSLNGSALSVGSSMDSMTLIQNKAADVSITFLSHA
jgi:hypothetical protein